MPIGDRIYERDELVRRTLRTLTQTAKERWRDPGVQNEHMQMNVRILGRLLRAGSTLTQAEQNRIFNPPVRRQRIITSPQNVPQGRGPVI